MPPMTGNFDANQFTPKQGGVSHPVGNKFPARISNTSIEPTKAGDGGMFVVEFTTPAGSIDMRYNLWNPNPQAVEISQGQLSALCHATGVFRLQWENEGAAMRSASCMIDVQQQTDKDGKPTNYTRVSKVYDAAGNEPGKSQAQPQQQPQGGQPMQQNTTGGWAQTGQQQPQGQPAQGNWPQQGNQQQPANQPQPNPPQQNWTQNNAPAGGQSANPPWNR